MATASRFTNGIVIRDGRPTRGPVINPLNETKISEIKVIETSLSPAQVTSATVAAQTLTVTGVRTGDVLIPLATPISNATALVEARVTANNSVAAYFANPTTSVLTPSAGVYKFLSIRYATN